MFFCDTQMPASLLLRGKLGLERSISNRKVFHIWLHPWTLLNYEGLKDDLDKFLKYVSKRREKGELEVMTMGELASGLNKEKSHRI